MTNKPTTEKVDLEKMKEDAKETARQAKADAKAERKKKFASAYESTKDVIIGLWQMFVFIGVCLTAGVIFRGTDDDMLKFLTLPQLSYAAYLLISKFLKK